jgi:hypothetical protein
MQTDLCSQMMIEILSSIIDELCFDVCADIHRAHLMRMLALQDLPGHPVPHNTLISSVYAFSVSFVRLFYDDGRTESFGLVFGL